MQWEMNEKEGDHMKLHLFIIKPRYKLHNNTGE